MIHQPGYGVRPCPGVFVSEGFQRAIADFVCFHCPLVASAEAKSLRIGKNFCDRSTLLQ